MHGICDHFVSVFVGVTRLKCNVFCGDEIGFYKRN